MDPNSPNPPEIDMCQVNVPLPEGQTVVNYAVVLLTDQGLILVHAPKDETGNIDGLNAVDLLIQGAATVTSQIKVKKQKEKQRIAVVPANGLPRLVH